MRRVLDWVADRLGYVDLRTAARWQAQAENLGFSRGLSKGERAGFDRGHSVGYRAGADYERTKTAGAIAQRDTLQRLYDQANRRLEKAGMISVTTFV